MRWEGLQLFRDLTCCLTSFSWPLLPGSPNKGSEQTPSPSCCWAVAHLHMRELGADAGGSETGSGWQSLGPWRVWECEKALGSEISTGGISEVVDSISAQGLDRDRLNRENIWKHPLEDGADVRGPFVQLDIGSVGPHWG